MLMVQSLSWHVGRETRAVAARHVGTPTWPARAPGIPIVHGGGRSHPVRRGGRDAERNDPLRRARRRRQGVHDVPRPAIGREAAKFEGRHAHISFHEEERNGFQNVYLDAIWEADERPQSASGNTDPDEVAWNTAVEAAPWMLGSREPQDEIPPEELYEKLEPFKRLVADDIREGTQSADD